MVFDFLVEDLGWSRRVANGNELRPCARPAPETLNTTTIPLRALQQCRVNVSYIITAVTGEQQHIVLHQTRSCR